MDKYKGFKKMLAGLKMADEGRDEIMNGLEEAFDASKNSDEMIEEMKDSIKVLQDLVLDLSKEVSELKGRL